MQSDYAPSFVREMTCTQADWVSRLPAAIGEHRWQAGEGWAQVALDAGRLRLSWEAMPPLAIALVRMQRLRVRFEFEDVDAAARRAFMARFDLYLQRGGG